MDTFGIELRKRRVNAGWRQQDLVAALGNHLARSTVANIEAGREPPSPRLWALIEEHLPEWATALAPAYETVRREAANGTKSRVDATAESPTTAYTLGGPFVIEELQLVYVFRHSRAPEEIIETRRVRATKATDGYGLKLARHDASDFEVDEEPLWGGRIQEHEHHHTDGQTVYLRRFEFDRRLRRGQTHEFAVRSWVERDSNPGTSVAGNFTIPCRAFAIHLNFFGPEKPSSCWRFGPIGDVLLQGEHAPTSQPVPLSLAGTVSAHFNSIEPGAEYGIGWNW